MAIIELTENNYNEILSGESGYVIIEFWKNGCLPCQALRGELEKVAETRDDVKFFAVNGEETPELISKYSVMTMPTLILAKEEKTLKKSIGFKSEEHINEWINSVIK